ncbi:hypothetical protein [Collimonas humicola]|uniref:hypothetical protein n=1 Tax=Collimonas humicola TaxID=2825886 RepID=UPI001B8D831A|nr:hypothetical protein [Collimonas humicola]
MKASRKHDVMDDDLVIAIGLIWGHLNAHQFESAYQLVCGCLRLWPQEKRLHAMAIYAAVELNLPLDMPARPALLAAGCKEWADMVMQRAASNQSLENA